MPSVTSVFKFLPITYVFLQCSSSLLTTSLVSKFVPIFMYLSILFFINLSVTSVFFTCHLLLQSSNSSLQSIFTLFGLSLLLSQALLIRLAPSASPPIFSPLSSLQLNSSPLQPIFTLHSTQSLLILFTTSANPYLFSTIITSTPPQSPSTYLHCHQIPHLPLCRILSCHLYPFSLYHSPLYRRT